ncbi:MAG: hypothetical protein ABW061_10485 [Polyangiaceae bacterium]
MKANDAPGAALLHPLAPLSLCVLLFNDHWLKRTHPGVLSGKLSDFAVMFLLPVLWHALFEVAYAFLSQRVPRASLANRALICCILLSCLVFALPELWQPAEDAYCIGMALLNWPFSWLIAALSGQAPPAFVPAAATADITDLLALSSAYWAWRVARRAAPTSNPASFGAARALTEREFRPGR